MNKLTLECLTQTNAVDGHVNNHPLTRFFTGHAIGQWVDAIIAANFLLYRDPTLVSLEVTVGEQNNFLFTVTDQTATIGFNKAFTKFLGKGITLSWAGCFELGPQHLIGDKSEIDANI